MITEAVQCDSAMSVQCISSPRSSLVYLPPASVSPLVPSPLLKSLAGPKVSELSQADRASAARIPGEPVEVFFFELYPV